MCQGSGDVTATTKDGERPFCDDLKLWYAVRRKAGLDDVRLHDLRHAYVSHAVMQGTPLSVVAKLLGHAQATMTLRYAHVLDKEVTAAAERTGTAIVRLCAQQNM